MVFGLQDEFVFTLDDLARCIVPSADGKVVSADAMINIPVTTDADYVRPIDSDADPFPRRRVSSHLLLEIWDAFK